MRANRGEKEETPEKVEIEDDIKIDHLLFYLFSGQIIGTQYQLLIYYY